MLIDVAGHCAEQILARFEGILVENGQIDRQIVVLEEDFDGFGCNVEGLVFGIAVDSARNQRKGDAFARLLDGAQQAVAVTGGELRRLTVLTALVNRTRV
jgi:pyruvate dehydrogenase complex dehydrogenase (E1) component